MSSPSPFNSVSFLDHLADAAENISQVVSDQDVLVNQAYCEFGQLQRVVESQSNEIHKLQELVSQSTQEFDGKMLELSEARYLHKTAEVTIKEQDWVIKELQDSLIESHNLQLAAEALAQGHGVELSQFHSVYKELCHLLNIEGLPLEPVTTSTIAPMDICAGPSG
ncbi:hypothetical protein GYMLUDRAFT_250356 [Collybiopsis luxurians FD-317 M1]|uniref:Uncharacterized protein n=1 Tax=Collybiopsis luxurians FD-317 M1 TaxID=944289 RepID=A0A0D0CF31_9AGAR|nr:hypothetical protein GYMLUDRAFT_250356 [Collybiopsis luxurians FD-317 M1]